MNTLSAQEIKRRGVAAIDDMIENGPVHVIRNNQPQYVVLSETRYQELIKAENEAYIERIKISLTDLQKGKIHHFKNVHELLKTIDEK